MRPRINNKFGRITRSELDIYLMQNSVYGFTAKKNPTTIVYSYFIMFRHNRKDPEMLFVEVSRNSKLVLSAYTNEGKTFNSVYDLLKYTKK